MKKDVRLLCLLNHIYFLVYIILEQFPSRKGRSSPCIAVNYSIPVFLHAYVDVVPSVRLDHDDPRTMLPITKSTICKCGPENYPVDYYFHTRPSVSLNSHSPCKHIDTRTWDSKDTVVLVITLTFVDFYHVIYQCVMLPKICLRVCRHIGVESYLLGGSNRCWN